MPPEAGSTTDGTSGSAGTAGQAAAGSGEAKPSTTNGAAGTAAAGGTPATPEDVTGLKSALEAERTARREAESAKGKAERERDDLVAANATDQEKALKEAVKTAETGERDKAKTAFRALRVEVSLIGAGMKPGMARDLATSSRFSAIKVNDDYTVDQAALDAGIGELKSAEPGFFSGSQPAGQVARGPQHQAKASSDVAPGPARLRSVERVNTKR